MNPGAPGDGQVDGDGRAAAALLRHDLVTPIHQILGYADLLIDDADDRGRAYRSMTLRSIRATVWRALEAIDGALIREPGDSRPPDLAALVPAVTAPSEALVESCRALEDASALAEDRESFLEDLARIREAAANLGRMARESGPQGGPGAKSSSRGSVTAVPDRADR